MATAAMKGHASANRSDAGAASELASMEFRIVEDNGGHFHWTLLDHAGNSLGRSPGLASYQDAENAAGVVLAGAGSARLDRRAAIDSSRDIPR